MPVSKPTIADVAHAAGVSVSTVSRVLNNKTDVSERTRDRVQTVMHELGYKPLLGARQLRDRKSRNIALLFPLRSPNDFSYTAFEMEFIIGASTAAGERDYLLSLVTARVDDHTLLSYYQSTQVDGVVLMQVHVDDWRVKLLHENDLPFVMIGHSAENHDISYIDLDFENSIVQAFEHLIQLGHKHIGFITIAEQLHKQGFGPAVRAWQGYERVIQFYGVAPLYQQAMGAGEDIELATLCLLDEQPEMTAIVSLHETTVSSIIKALADREKGVPDDCSILALMNERMAKMTSPSVTRIHFPAFEMGYQAIHTLIRQLEGELNIPEQVLIPPQLIVGASTSIISKSLK